MTAPFAHPPPADCANRAAAWQSLCGRKAGTMAAALSPALLAGVTAFFCMLPYPAYAIGNATALQIGNVCVMAACLPLLSRSWHGRTFHVYLVLLAPLVLSSLMTALSGSSQASLSLKCTVVWAVSLLALTFVQLYGRDYALQMLVGIAAATLLHAVVGVWQIWAFSRDYFPLVSIYVNPSFLSVQENAETIARWTKRPFGLFPEPSAMSASLSPWLLIWIALLAGLLRLRQPLANAHRLLFAAAAAGALVLMIASRSGQTAVTTLAALALCGLWLVRARATPRTFGLVMVAFGVVLPIVLWFAAQSVADRLGGVRLGNSSWEERASSIVAAAGMFAAGDMKTLLIGFGPGLTSFAVTQARGLEALWSITLSYAFDTGFVGITALVWLGSLLLRNWLKVRAEPTFALVAAVWTVGVTLTTSYEQLLPLWLALGWLTVWPEVFQPALTIPELRAVSKPVVARRYGVAGIRTSPWRALLPATASAGLSGSRVKARRR